jgi:predicted RNase H-like nuclease (RuvC/YqgF family)
MGVEISMKNTLKPLPSFSREGTMRTNESEYKRLEDTIEQIKAENAELRKDNERLDWILNNYTLSCGITREEVDEKIAELR